MTYEEQFPCRAQIIRAKVDRGAAPLNQYHLPKDDGVFTGTLAFRCWHRNKPMLLCCFDMDDGQKVMLQAWYQNWGVNYSPKDTLINFADEVFDGSRWRCVYRKKRNGYISWRRAEPVP